jgi:hypothetical protein
MSTGIRHRSRSYLTCLNKCGNACDQPSRTRPTPGPHTDDFPRPGVCVAYRQR